MNADFSDVQCHTGDEAVSSDEHTLGKIVAIDARFVTVEHGRLSKGRYYVPRHALDARVGQTIYLKVTKAQADHGDWGSAPTPPAARAPLASADAWAQPSPPASAPARPTPAAPAPSTPAPAAPAAASWIPPAVEPSVNDLRPLLAPDVENEPMLLLDTTGSMSYPVAADSAVQRREVIGEAIGRIVETLAAQDSQAAKEQAAGEAAGGLMTITFAGGGAQCIEDLNPANWRQKWRAIAWGGGTQIMPGWRLLMATYQEEFGGTPAPERPRLLALIITDGEADDTAEFAQTLAQASGGVYVCVAILGFGGEHDQALAAYQGIAAANDHVRVVSFGSETDPAAIADGLLSLLGRAA